MIPRQMIRLSLLLFIFGCIGTGENNNSNETVSSTSIDKTKKEVIEEQVDENTLVFGLKNSQLFNETIFDDFKHRETYTPKNIKARLQPEFLIRFESQIAIAVRPIIKGSNVYPIPICTFDSYLIDETIYGDLTKQCFIQFGEHDFDNDNISEIIIAFGKRGSYLKCYIFKYHEPANIADAGRDENWSLVGNFDEYGYHDTRYVTAVEKNKIYFPYGSQGASEGFIFVDDKFIKVQ